MLDLLWSPHNRASCEGAEQEESQSAQLQLGMQMNVLEKGDHEQAGLEGSLRARCMRSYAEHRLVDAVSSHKTNFFSRLFCSGSPQHLLVTELYTVLQSAFLSTFRGISWVRRKV